MKLLSVELENIFAYERQVEVPLHVVTPEKNVILIWGRNGMGKTSFLNSLKLLFLGAESPEMRWVGFPRRQLPPRQFVMGDGANWSGVINRKALHRAQTAGHPVTARVKARWEMANSQMVTAERQWTVTSSGYVESLSVVDGAERLTGSVAQDRLEDFVPREFVGFFFFDGEDIKQLAETEDRKQIDFDRLLRITFVQNLAEELRNLASERGRHRVSAALREEIGRLEQELTRARVTRDDAKQKLSDLDDLIATDLAELRRLSVRRENLSAGASDAQRAALEARLKELGFDLGEAEYAVAEAVPASAPVLANLNLVELALKAVDERLSAARAVEQVLARRIQHELPDWIAEAPVDLTKDAVDGIAASVCRRIDELVAPRGENGLFGRLDPLRADQMYKQLQHALLLGSDRREDQIRQLANVRRLRREIADTREALMRLEVGSQANLEEYRHTVDRMRNLDEQLAGYRQTKGQIQVRYEDAEAQAQEHTARLRELRAQEEIALKRGDEARFILKLASTMEDLREALRKATRQKIERLINERFHSLVYDHDLIKRIEIDDNYTLTFLDGSGRKIGRASLSSGLKQLAATALLWAMKDTVGQEMPVVIDTPLGRIDRENQDQMLINYYPRLSSQVIVLPTNAEIDERKLAMLLPRVAAQYHIRNSSGDSADILKGPLAQVGVNG